MFSKPTSTIVRKGWAQVRWLIIGKGEGGSGAGRWDRSEYPELVQRFADRNLDDFEQEMEGCDSHQSATEVTSNAVGTPKSASATERQRNTHVSEV